MPLRTRSRTFGPHEPDPRRLIAFLKAMEFNALLRRVAASCAVDPAAIDAEARLLPGGEAIGSGAGEGAAVPFFDEAAPATEARDRDPFAGLGLPEGAAPRRKTIPGQAAPATLVAERAAERAARPFDRDAYETVAVARVASTTGSGRRARKGSWRSTPRPTD